jgi:hypothetical protein
VSALRAILVAIAIALFARAASAGNVRFTTPKGEVYVGQSVDLVVQIDRAQRYEPPQQPPEVPGAMIQLLDPDVVSSTTIVNGKRSDSLNIRLRFRITPTVAGTLTVPAIPISVDGSLHASPAFTLTVKPAEAGDLVFAEVVTADTEVFVGEPLTATLRIWIKPFVSEEFSITVPATNMFQLMADQSRWGVFLPSLEAYAQRDQHPQAKNRERMDLDGKPVEYYLFEIERTFWPARPGLPDLGDLSIRMEYPTRLEQSTDPFRRGLRMASPRLIVVEPTPPNVVVTWSFSPFRKQASRATSAAPSDSSRSQPA